MKKRLLALILAGVLSLSAALTGCGGGDSSTSSGADSGSSDGGSSESTSGEAAWDTTKNDTIVVSVINNYYTAGWKKMAEDYMACILKPKWLSMWWRITIPTPKR